MYCMMVQNVQNKRSHSHEFTDLLALLPNIWIKKHFNLFSHSLHIATKTKSCFYDKFELYRTVLTHFVW